MARDMARTTARKQPAGAAPEAERARFEIIPGGVPEAYCREPACESLATTTGYCRLHYIKNWHDIKRKEEIVREGKLREFLEDLAQNFPHELIKAVRRDLSSEEAFEAAVRDLDLHLADDESIAIDASSAVDDVYSIEPGAPPGEEEPEDEP